jgi:hypothetical protein
MKSVPFFVMAGARRLPIGTSLIRVIPESSVATLELANELKDERRKAQNDAFASSTASCVCAGDGDPAR